VGLAAISRSGGGNPPVASVYVHAPFCTRRCNYCDFAVQVAKHGDLAGWVEALRREWRGLQDEGWARSADRLETLYVGGGTPSHLGPEAMHALAEVFGGELLTHPGLEWTSEANPESFTRQVAEAWREAGVNRISLGVQSFDDSILRWMGRMHGAEGAEQAVRVARDAGLDNLSIDLIFGLPGRLDRDWAADLDRALALEAPHVSLYGLTVESGTNLGRAVAAGRELPINEERYREEYLLAVERLTRAGYDHYEVSNFARDGLVSLHNSVYWSGAPYLGLGNGAHSFVHPVRRWNLRAWETYRTRLAGGESAVAESETLDASALQLETIWLGLRTSRGLGTDGWDRKPWSLVERWARDGLARCLEGRVSLTAEGWLLMDRLTVELDDVLTGTSTLPDVGT
jgi:putative oxygen-independent coproporphyrinogen III oxidase